MFYAVIQINFTDQVKTLDQAQNATRLCKIQLEEGPLTANLVGSVVVEGTFEASK